LERTNRTVGQVAGRRSDETKEREMPVVTISRQFGAGGSSVAALVADALHAEIVDKKLIDEVAVRLHMQPGEVEAETERPRTMLERLVRSFSALEPGIGAAWTPPYPDPFFDARAEIIHLTEQVIREVASGGNVVIIGRGAGFVLRDVEGVFRVFLRAPEPIRVKVVMARFGYAESEARRKIQEVDSNRAAYNKQLYGHDWCDPDEHDLIINTGQIDYETASQIILTAVADRDKTVAPLA
jgi:cytidylate kinase